MSRQMTQKRGGGSIAEGVGPRDDRGHVGFRVAISRDELKQNRGL